VREKNEDQNQKERKIKAMPATRTVENPEHAAPKIVNPRKSCATRPHHTNEACIPTRERVRFSFFRRLAV
jgi:hypothetical protein